MTIKVLPTAVSRRLGIVVHLITRNSGPLVFRPDRRFGDITLHVGVVSHDSTVEFRVGRVALVAHRVA